MGPDQTPAYVQPSLAQPFVYAVAPGKRNWSVLRSLLRATDSAGSQTTGSHGAALAIEHGATVFPTDHDFERVHGVHLVNVLGPGTGGDRGNDATAARWPPTTGGVSYGGGDDCLAAFSSARAPERRLNML